MQSAARLRTFSQISIYLFGHARCVARERLSLPATFPHMNRRGLRAQEECAMTRQNQETRLQADPALRAGRAPWGWAFAVAALVLAIAIVLFATNQKDDSDVVEGLSPPMTSQGVPAAPPARSDSARETAAGPSRAPAPRSTTGSGQ
jgi:hypothetical protein